MKGFLILTTLLITGCTTTHDLGNGKYLVPRAIEERSLFGTNMGFAWIESCDGQVDPKKPGMLYTNCTEVTAKVPMSSQGQGGQITSGLLQAAGFWGLGALMPGSNSVTNSTVNSGNSGIIINGGGHGHK
jgi:hypothetical protein